MSPRIDREGSHGAPKKVLLLTPGIYSPTNYPGFYQKYREIASAFRRRACHVRQEGYNATIWSIWRLRKQPTLQDADIIWLRSPGVRLWLFVILFHIFFSGKIFVIEVPDPFRVYFEKAGSTGLKPKRLLHRLELIGTVLVAPSLGFLRSLVVEYANESAILHALFRLDSLGVLIGNPVPSEAVASVRTGLHPAGYEDLIFACIANVEVWHGLDRFIAGMSAYLKRRPSARLKLLVIGDIRGFVREQLDDLLLLYDLESYVEFVGVRHPSEISDICQRVDIAVGSLGLHRLGHHIASPIKSGVYLGMGIPFVTSYCDARFSRESFFVHQCQGSEAAIDIDAVLRWYRALDPVTTPRRMHEYFLNELSSDKLLAPVFDRLGIPPLSPAGDFLTADESAL